MTQVPKVSVLISFYNLRPYIDQTMEGVLAQKTCLLYTSPSPRD